MRSALVLSFISLVGCTSEMKNNSENILYFARFALSLTVVEGTSVRKCQNKFDFIEFCHDSAE